MKKPIITSHVHPTPSHPSTTGVFVLYLPAKVDAATIVKNPPYQSHSVTPIWRN